MPGADARWMDLANRLGRRALGQTAENPPVGCVLVKDDVVVGLGWTQAGGRPHAETMALAQAGAAARGATCYVTLEPCAHHGRTPPCAEALVKAGVARVVAALSAPAPRVAGRGLETRRTAGIVVDVGQGAAEARRTLAGFLNRILRKRPQVIAKLAVSADGKIAARAGEETRITGPEAQARSHLVRARADAILVGLGTVLADDPDLTCRLPGMGHRSPIRVVADSRLRIPHASRLVATAPETPLWLLATRAGAVAPGVTVISCAATAEGRVDLADALSQLAARGINSVLVEGGAALLASLWQTDLIDRFILYRSSDDLGPQGLAAGPVLTELTKRLNLITEEQLGADLCMVYERREQD